MKHAPWFQSLVAAAALVASGALVVACGAVDNSRPSDAGVDASMDAQILSRDDSGTDAPLPPLPDTADGWARDTVHIQGCLPEMPGNPTNDAEGWSFINLDASSIVTTRCIMAAKTCAEVLTCMHGGIPAEPCLGTPEQCVGTFYEQCIGRARVGGDCALDGASCVVNSDGRPGCSWGGCATTIGTCEGTNPKNCFSSVWRVDFCRPSTSCHVRESDNRALCAGATNVPCDLAAPPRCDGSVVVRCEYGFEERVDCSKGDQICVDTMYECQSAKNECDLSFKERCTDATTLEYCSNGTLRRIPCNEVNLATCSVDPGAERARCHE